MVLIIGEYTVMSVSLSDMKILTIFWLVTDKILFDDNKIVFSETFD